MEAFFSAVAAAYIRLIYRTNRWERVGFEIADRLLTRSAGRSSASGMAGC